MSDEGKRYCETCGVEMGLTVWIRDYDGRDGNPNWYGIFRCSNFRWWKPWAHEPYHKYFWNHPPEKGQPT